MSVHCPLLFQPVFWSSKVKSLACFHQEHLPQIRQLRQVNFRLRSRHHRVSHLCSLQVSPRRFSMPVRAHPPCLVSRLSPLWNPLLVLISRAMTRAPLRLYLWKLYQAAFLPLLHLRVPTWSHRLGSRAQCHRWRTLIPVYLHRSRLRLRKVFRHLCCLPTTLAQDQVLHLLLRSQMPLHLSSCRIQASSHLLYRRLLHNRVLLPYPLT